MKKLLICPKKSGNTFSVCDYLSKHAEMDLKILSKQNDIHLKEYDTIILSSGIYMGKAHINLMKWLESISEEQINPDTKFYMFVTWFGRGESDKTVFRKIDSTLKKADAKLEENYSSCFGQGMGLVQIGHPNAADLEKILNWVNDLEK